MRILMNTASVIIDNKCIEARLKGKIFGNARKIRRAGNSFQNFHGSSWLSEYII